MTDQNPINSPEKEPKPSQRRIVLKTMNFAIEFGFIIVVPLVTLGYLGKWLDTRYHKSYFVIFGIVLALLVSCIWFYRRIKDIINELKNP